MTRFVCSSCEISIPDDSRRCPRCGPESHTLIIGDDPLAPVHAIEGEVAQRLARALGSNYEVVRLLGRGGFAEVYEVNDVDLRRRLAVKTLRPDIAWTSGMLARFKQEARAIARLSHPHTVPIYFVGESEGLAFYAMRFVEGKSLAAMLRQEGPIDPERAIAIGAPIFDALQHAHEHGLVHRDIKPDNIMLEAATGRPLLVDFGIAKSLDDQTQNTQTGFVVGTPLYMSPEQALGQRDIDARSDVYAMGALLYQMLTGAPPFEGTTSQEIVSKHLTVAPPQASASDQRIPVWLSEVIVRCMAKRPADRYGSAALALEAIERGRASGAGEAITAGRLLSRISRDRKPAEPEVDKPTSGERVARWPLAAVGLVVVALVAALGRGAFGALERPHLVVRNHLLQPVRIAIDPATEVTIGAGDSVRVAVSRAAALSANWAAVRPVSAAGEPMGDEIRGVIVAEQPRGEMRHRIDAVSPERQYFTPLVTNATSGPLRVSVTDSAGGAPDCNCLVPPHRPAEHLGYWPLSAGASVVVTDASGRTFRFDSLAARLEPSTGALPLRVASADLPVGPTARRPLAARRRAERSAVVSEVTVAADATGSEADRSRPVPRSKPSPTKRRLGTTPEPLRGIFPRQ